MYNLTQLDDRGLDMFAFYYLLILGYKLIIVKTYKQINIKCFQ